MTVMSASGSETRWSRPGTCDSVVTACWMADAGTSRATAAATAASRL
jgi:hypothetical protein